MTIIGGTGTFSRPIIGTAALHMSNRLLGNPFTVGQTTVNLSVSWNLILGIAFIVVVLVFPKGIAGSVGRWRKMPCAPARDTGETPTTRDKSDAPAQG